MKRILLLELLMLFVFSNSFSQKLSMDTTKLKKWEFGVGIGAILCPQLTNPKNSTLKLTSSIQITPELNFYVSYNITKNWSLQSGMGVSINKYSCTYNGLYVIKTDSLPNWRLAPTVYHQSAEYYKISLPLYAAYNFSNLICHNIDLYLKWGGALNFTQKYHDKLYYNTANETIIDETYPKFETRKLIPFKGYSDRPYNWNASLFLGNKIHIKKNLLLYYEMGASYGYRELVFNSYFFDLYAKSTGLNVSTNLHLCF